MTAQEQPQLDERTKIQMPGMFIPGFRSSLAIQRGVEKNLLFSTFGGIGDHVCQEPTMRYAFEHFTDCRISLVSRLPELFQHLPFAEVHSCDQMPDLTKYLVFNLGVPPGHVTTDFFSHGLTGCLDFPALCALHIQLPVRERFVKLVPAQSDHKKVHEVSPHNAVVIHPGRHWPSKTFPKAWWDCLTDELVRNGGVPVIIGSAKPGAQGTVDVDTDGCIDLRDRLTIMQTVALLDRCKVLLTNDSAPMHLAAPSQCHIGFLATSKHPDYIMHWRRNANGRVAWAWRQKNFSLGGMWELEHFCPNRKTPLKMDQVDAKVLNSWLPHPAAMARWALSTLAQKPESE